MSFLTALAAKILPTDWSLKVAIQKMAFTAGKVAVSFVLASKAGPSIQAHTTPDQVLAVQSAVGIAVGASLEATLDWLKMHYPEKLGWLR